MRKVYHERIQGEIANLILERRPADDQRFLTGYFAVYDRFAHFIPEWLFIRADGYLLPEERELLLGHLVRRIAVDGHRIQIDAVVDHAVDGRHRVI